MYKDETGHISNFLLRNLIVVLQLGNKGGEGEGEVGYNIMIVHIRVAACLKETKKGGETSKSIEF